VWALEAVHTKELIKFVSNSWESLRKFRGDDAGEVVPEVFPPVWRGQSHVSSVFHLQAGLFTYDTATPIGKDTSREARRSAAISIDAAKILAQNPSTPIYALCRPPGHHATKDHYGGYCYFNNAALAANILSQNGHKVVVFDIDYHHGNGTQDIFYHRNDVFYISIHGSPDFEYPFFSGGANEVGEGAGLNFNKNFPLPGETAFDTYYPTFGKALEVIKQFSPNYLVVSLGFDAADGDPICSFHLKPNDYYVMGNDFKKLGIPLLIVQEGGYSKNEVLGSVAKSFMEGVLGLHKKLQ